MRVSWEFRLGVEGICYTRLYINGIAVGSEHSTSSFEYQPAFEDIIDIVKDDLIQIYGRGDEIIVYVQNMRVKYDEFENNDP